MLMNDRSRIFTQRSEVAQDGTVRRMHNKTILNKYTATDEWREEMKVI